MSEFQVQTILWVLRSFALDKINTFNTLLPKIFNRLNGIYGYVDHKFYSNPSKSQKSMSFYWLIEYPLTESNLLQKNVACFLKPWHLNSYTYIT